MNRKKKTTGDEELKSEKEMQIKMVAFLSGHEQESQIDIAEKLGISQAQVSRHIGFAKSKGWLKSTTACELTPDELRKVENEIQQRLIPSDLEKNLQKLATRSGITAVRNIRVFNSGHTDTDEFGVFGRQAAGYVRDLILKARFVGITWGRTLFGLLEGLRALRIPSPWSEEPTLFFPLRGELQLGDPKEAAGDPIYKGKDLAELSPSNLVVSFNQMVNGDRNEPITLFAAPCFIPHVFKGKELATIKRFIQSTMTFKRIFGPGDTALIDGMDTILSAVGTIAHPSPIDGIMVAQSDESRSLIKHAVGDLGGIFIPKAKLNAAGMNYINSLEDRWPGMNLGHFRRCAKQAGESGMPGVILLNIGEKRAEAVYGCLKMGLVNELIIDQWLAKKLLTLVQEDINGSDSWPQLRN